MSAKKNLGVERATEPAIKGEVVITKAPAKAADSSIKAKPPSPVRPNLRRGLVTIYAYKLAEAPPSAVAFSGCMVRFLGWSPSKANPELIWGIHGTASLRDSTAYADVDAQFRGLRTFRLALNYRLPKLTGVKNAVTAEISKETGFLHCMRLSSAYRGGLQKRMIKWLQEDRDPDAARLARAKFVDLLKQRPMLIHRLMAEDTFLNMVIHPVLLNGGVTLTVGTVRNLPELIDGVNAGVHTGISARV